MYAGVSRAESLTVDLDKKTEGEYGVAAPGQQVRHGVGNKEKNEEGKLKRGHGDTSGTAGAGAAASASSAACRRRPSQVVST